MEKINEIKKYCEKTINDCKETVAKSPTGVSFISIKGYQNCYGEVSNNLINIGVSYENMKKKDIQSLTENNLKSIFGLDFVKSEFSLNNFRIDTLAFDKDASAFVIIEYKRDKNFSVIDQGYAYLSLMLNNKADFILEFNENSKHTLKRNDVDWSQSRVIFISPSFTAYQKEAINFKDLPIELWEIKRYDNQTVIYNQIKSSGAQESVKNH